MEPVTYVILITCIAAQVVLLLYALVRSKGLKTGRLPLPSMITLGAVALAAYFIPADDLPVLTPTFATALAMAAMLALTGALIQRDLTQRPGAIWLLGGLVWVGLMLGAAFVDQPVTIGEPGWIVMTFQDPGLPALVTIGGLVVIGVLLLVRGFYSFYTDVLPESSNRALFWVLNSTVLLMSFVLLITGAPVLALIGGLLLTGGTLGAVYSQTSYRVFDIRGVLGLGVRILLLISFTTAAILFSVILLEALQLANLAERLIVAATISLAVAALYTPVREFTIYLVDRVLMGRRTDPIRATREYSQAVSRAQEINELIDLSARSINAVMRVKRSGMLLVSDNGTDFIELLVMRGGGFTQQAREHRHIRMAADSPIYRRIVSEQRTISQFDIEFSPAYDDAPDSERDSFRKLGMSAYAPIIIDDSVVGLLAAGAKVNDAPYYYSDISLLGAMANQTGVALRNTRLVADLRHLNDSMQAMNRSLGDANDRMGKLDSVKTDFVTIASHELRTPLAQVRGYTDILDALNEQGMLDQDQTRGLVSNLRKATERMEELIAAMLDVSQLDVNAMDLRFAQTSIESVLRMAIDPLTDPIKQRKLTLSARGLRGLPPIEADMQRLVQAFRNVIVNAIKFTPDGGRIDISARLEENNGKDKSDYIIVSVVDTGVGIDQVHLDLIFNKFYRAYDPGTHSTGTYKFMGAGPGLGLTIAQGVVEGHGGFIWAESPGHNMQTYPGSTFYIKLPLVPPESARRVLPFEDRDRSENRAAFVRATNPRRSNIPTDQLPVR